MYNNNNGQLDALDEELAAGWRPINQDFSCHDGLIRHQAEDFNAGLYWMVLDESNVKDYRSPPINLTLHEGYPIFYSGLIVIR